MKIEIKHLSDRECRLVIDGVHPYFVNALRRTLLSEVPKLAIHKVTFYDNTSALFDEIISHRIGLLPVPTDPSTLNRTMGVNMLGSEGPDHQRIRSVVESPFRPREVEARTRGRLTAMADELIDGFAGHGSCDLFRAFCEPFSVLSLRFMLGLIIRPAWGTIAGRMPPCGR